MIDHPLAIAVETWAGAGFRVLLDTAIKGTVLLLAAGLVTILLSRRSAAHRHAVWTAAMLGLLLLPFVSALVPGRAWRVLPNLTEGTSAVATNTQDPSASPVAILPIAHSAAQQATPNPTPSPDVETSPQKNQGAATLDSSNLAQQKEPASVAAVPTQSPRTASGPTAPASTAPMPFHRQRSLAAIILIAWAVGAGLCLLTLCVDLLALKWMAAGAVQITRGPWMETFDRVRRGIALPPVILLEREGSGMPLAYGIVAPTLVLPGEAHAWPPQRRQAVLAHELAHVNRRDCATQLLARFACAMHWFNPLAWYAARRLRVERERACDDLVIGSAGGRGGAAAAPQPDAAAAEYASHLLEVARSLRAARLGALAGVAMARPSQLEGRLLAVLDQQRDHRPVGSRFVAGGIVTVLVSIGLLAFVRLVPRAVAQEAIGAPHSSAQAPDTEQAPAAGTQQTPTFAKGQKVQVKWGGIWRKAVVVNHRGQWLLIDYDGNKSFREWVEPWRARSIGSAYEISGPAPIHPYVHHNEGPPRELPGPAPADASDNGGGATSDEAQSDVPVTPVGRQNARLISLDALPPLQAWAPDAAPAVQWATSPILLRGSSGKFFDHPEALLLSPASGVGAVLHFNAPPGNERHQYRVERFDLKTGQSLNVSSLPLELELLDLSSDGRLLLARTGPFGPGHGARLDVWQIDGEKAVHVISLMPFTARTGGEKVVWAKFVGPDHILARSFDGELSCYAFKTATQLWSAKPGLTNHNALSATGKYVAASTGKSIAILEPISGKVLGAIDLDGRPAQSLAFKPDGKAIAAAGQDEVATWDLSKAGALVSDSWAVGAPGQHVDWGEGNYILLDHSHLVSPDKKLVVWAYEGVGAATHGQLAEVWNGRMYYTADAASSGSSHRPVVASVALPDEQVGAKIISSGEPKLALKPGTSVGLDVQVQASIRQKVIDALTSKLKDNGVTIANDAPVRVTVKDEPGETRDVSYRRIGFRAFGQTDKVRVKEIKRSIAISVDGQAPAWQRAGTMMPPMFLSLKEGQSIDQAVKDAMKPSAKFYQGIRIPELIPEQPDGFAVTPLSASGPQTARAPRPKPVQKTPSHPAPGTQVRAGEVGVGVRES
jgi:beta-lactamase regulating signal transducer with metallopeptidase domain